MGNQPSSVHQDESEKINISQRESIQEFIYHQRIQNDTIDSMLETLEQRKYKINGSLGQGAFGIVFKATNKFQKEVAIKVLLCNQSSIEECRIEINNLKQINSKNVIKLIDDFYDKDEKICFIVTEFCKQKTLSHYLFSNPHPDEESIQKIFKGIVNGIIDIHKQKIIHSDLKPDNILLDKDNEVKICDFGFSIQKENSNVSLKEGKGRNNQCCSPEQLLGRVGFPSDIFAAGKILEMLCQDRQKKNEPQLEFPRFAKLIEQMTQQVTANRISLEKIKEELDQNYYVEEQQLQQTVPIPQAQIKNKLSYFQEAYDEIENLRKDHFKFKENFLKKWK